MISKSVKAYSGLKALFLSSCLVLAGCAGTNLAPRPEDEVNFDIYGRRLPRGEKQESLLESYGLWSGGKSSSDAGAQGENQLRVNKYLWRSALDTLAFIPLATTDPFGGVITSEWGSFASSPHERIRVSAYITSDELKTESLKVVVNRQLRKGEEWVNDLVSPEVAKNLETAILLKARQLKTAGLSD